MAPRTPLENHSRVFARFSNAGAYAPDRLWAYRVLDSRHRQWGSSHDTSAHEYCGRKRKKSLSSVLCNGIARSQKKNKRSKILFSRFSSHAENNIRSFRLLFYLLPFFVCTVANIRAHTLSTLRYPSVREQVCQNIIKSFGIRGNYDIQSTRWA